MEVEVWGCPGRERITGDYGQIIWKVERSGEESTSPLMRDGGQARSSTVGRLAPCEASRESMYIYITTGDCLSTPVMLRRHADLPLAHAWMLIDLTTTPSLCQYHIAVLKSACYPSP